MFRFVLVFVVVAVGFIGAHLLGGTPQEVTRLLLIVVLVFVVNLSIDVWTLKKEREKDRY